MFFMLHKCDFFFFAHTHIHDCEHVIKFVMEEIRETALWKLFLNLDKI